MGETVETAAAREAAEETGLAVELTSLIGVYSDPERDPRGHSVSVASLARVVGWDLIVASDVAEVSLVDPETVDLSFDHGNIIADATG